MLRMQNSVQKQGLYIVRNLLRFKRYSYWTLYVSKRERGQTGLGVYMLPCPEWAGFCMTSLTFVKKLLQSYDTDLKKVPKKRGKSSSACWENAIWKNQIHGKKIFIFTQITECIFFSLTVVA